MRKLVLLSCVIACAASVYAADASGGAKAYAEAQALLQKGDLQAAVRQFSAAAKLAPENTSYREQALLVFRVARMQQGLERIDDSDRWLQSAYALHKFYLTHEVDSLALKTAAAIHAKQNDADSAALLARTQLEADQNKEAAELLKPLTGEQATPEVKALRGVALARLAQAEPAGAELTGMKLADDCKAQLACDVARLQALLGKSDDACKSLTAYFQKTPPSLLDAARDYVKTCPDFATLTSGDAFATALKTESLVKESDCSSGSSCGSCPSRGSCGSSSGSSCSE